MVKSTKRMRTVKEHSPSLALEKKLSAPTGNIFDSMIQLEEETVEKIVANLLDPENVEMKTRIGVPLNLSRLELIGTWYEIEKLPKSKKVIETFARFLRVNEVSLDGKSREEIVRILSEAMKQERSLQDKLAAPPPE